MTSETVGAILSFAIFFSLSSTVFFFGFRYLQRKWVREVNWPSETKRYITAFSWALLIALFSGFFSRFTASPAAEVIAWLSYVVMGFLALLIFITGLIHAFRKWQHVRAPEAAAAGLSRKDFLKTSLAVPALALTASTEAVGIKAARSPEIVPVDIFFDNLPDEFNGFKLAQISDLHVGLTIRRDFVERVVALTNDAKPDAIALTGDIMDGTVEMLQYDMEPIQALEAPSGRFFITGNHEYYSGALPWVEYFKAAGFSTLINSNELIERGSSQIAMCGITDRSAHRIVPEHKSNAQQAVKGLKNNTFKIMLAHQPRSVYEIENTNSDLMLCGHTHGGQFFPWSLLVHFAHPYVKGLHQHNSMQVYVNQGTGYWGPPMRIGTIGEISLITLRKK